MRKHIILLILSLFSLAQANAIHVANNVDINTNICFVSKYVYRGSCLSYENIMTHVKFGFGNDSTIGTFIVHPWFSIGHDTEKKFFYEFDAIVGYTTPGDYFSIACKYLNYKNIREEAPNHELQIGIVGNLADILPLSIMAETTVLNDNFLYDTNVVLSYNGIYKRWYFIPSLGCRFGCFNPYGYLQFDTRYNIVLSQNAGLFVQLSGNINSIEINNFTYQKNFNGWLACGFVF